MIHKTKTKYHLLIDPPTYVVLPGETRLDDPRPEIAVDSLTHIVLSRPDKKIEDVILKLRKYANDAEVMYMPDVYEKIKPDILKMDKEDWIDNNTIRIAKDVIFSMHSEQEKTERLPFRISREIFRKLKLKSSDSILPILIDFMKETYLFVPERAKLNEENSYLLNIFREWGRQSIDYVITPDVTQIDLGEINVKKQMAMSIRNQEIEEGTVEVSKNVFSTQFDNWIDLQVELTSQ